jgi:hypothetical protein
METPNCRLVSQRCHPDSDHLRTVGTVHLATTSHSPAVYSVAAAFRRSFRISADSPDASIRTAGYEYIPVDVHIPVLDIPMAVNERRSHILSDAVIQGRPSTDRLVSHTRCFNKSDLLYNRRDYADKQ